MLHKEIQVGSLIYIPKFIYIVYVANINLSTET